MSHRSAHILCILTAILLSTTSVAAAPCAARGTPAAKATDSKVCLSCHDGVLAPNAAHASFTRGGLATYHGRGSHPVDINYALAFVRKPRRFHAPASLDPRIKLAKGKLTCTSCHDLASTEKKSLVMSNEKSALCLSCHHM